MNALYILGPLRCKRVDRLDNIDGSSTITLNLESSAQHMLNTAPHLSWVVLNRVVYTPSRTPRGDILRLRSVVNNKNTLPIPNIISAPLPDDIPVASPTGLTLYVLGAAVQGR